MCNTPHGVTVMSRKANSVGGHLAAGKLAQNVICYALH